jgi:hypothetical protein
LPPEESVVVLVWVKLRVSDDSQTPIRRRFKLCRAALFMDEAVVDSQDYEVLQMAPRTDIRNVLHNYATRSETPMKVGRLQRQHLETAGYIVTM